MRDRFYAVVKTYERLMTARPCDAFSATKSMLDDLAQTCRHGGLLERGCPPLLVEHLYTRLASMLTKFVTEEGAQITYDQLWELAKRKQTIAYIFNASGFRNMRHFIDLMATNKEDGTRAISLSKAPMILACVGLDDLDESLLNLALKQPPRVMLILMLGWLNQRAILTEQGEKNRSRLLTAGRKLDGVEISDREIPLLINAWMYTSYATLPEKHDLKFWLNKLLADRLNRAGVHYPDPAREIKTRPTVVIVLERFTNAHAMFRCWAKVIERMKPRFHLVAIADEKTVDGSSDELFDDVIRLAPKRPSVSQIAKLIQEVGPDIVFYPSLGMSHWTVMLSVLRLAPIQVAGMGHPATTKSNAIDFIYTPAMQGDLTKVFSERVLVGQENTSYAPHPDLPDPLPELSAPSHREVRIAVNSKVMKLSYQLVKICRRLAANTSTPLRFDFFPGETGVYFDGINAAIKAQLPGATVHHYASYPDFLSKIANCDLALSAFPFGNTNSTVDTTLLGLPTVAFFGPEPPAQSDERVLRSAGRPSWTVCSTIEEYYETALKLVEDKNLRSKSAGSRSREEIRNSLFAPVHDENAAVFSDMLWLVYNSFEEIVAQDLRVMTQSDLLSLRRSSHDAY